MSAIMLGASFGAISDGIVTVSGENISAAQLGTAVAAVRFNSAGTVDRGLNGSFTQIDIDTDWIRPVSAAPGLYEIRLTVVSGNSPTGASAAINTWLPLTATRFWELSNSAIGSRSGVWGVEIRLGSGPVLDSANYNMTATVDVP